jgi:hypothetical protein
MLKVIVSESNRIDDHFVKRLEAHYQLRNSNDFVLARNVRYVL